MIRTVAIALLGALCTLAAGDAVGQGKKFVIAAPGIPPVFASAILYVADKEGMFKKYGVNVEIRPFETGATASRAVISGDIEMSLSPTALLISQVSNTNAPIVAVYGLVSSDFLLASTDAAKTACSDLIGQAVGVDAIGGARSIALRTMLNGGCNGMKLDQVRQIPLSSNVAPALIAGQLKFGVVHLDDVATIELQGKKVYTLATEHKANPNGHYLSFIVRQDRLKENRDTYVRVMAALIAAARFIRDPHNADRVGEDATPTGHTKEVSKATIKPLIEMDYWPVEADGLDQKRFDSMLGVVQRTGGIQPGKTPASYDRLTDGTVFRDALAMVNSQGK
ncbi:MAG TPA: ABC transporter substrate-binding protein [Xanthobacteraceae bacterium]|jgi:NitT/TauT family transport system substrate-binding protein